MARRLASIERKTKETDIAVTLNLDGSGKVRVKSGISFIDHMLDLFGKHGLFDISVSAKGDIAVDDHNLVEDLGISLGQALKKALGKKEGIARYGSARIPMDEALLDVAIDLGGRPYLVYDVKTPAKRIKNFEVQLVEEFMRAFSV
ncbi:MAG: imidazoleglycerol-phosphate dehydratase, partial [Thermoplasmata archaeon]|nr:imidazoleglycerol-phosphate dehydratase [Thermoplasmata archaeon]